MANGLLYDDVVAITYEYLGPAADRFVSRQIKNHLDKSPDMLQRRDLTSLIDWIRLAMGMLSDDAHLVDSYIEELQGLAYSKTPKRRHGQASVS